MALELVTSASSSIWEKRSCFYPVRPSATRPVETTTVYKVLDESSSSVLFSGLLDYIEGKL